MKPTVVEEVANIFDLFNLEEISKLLNAQLASDPTENAFNATTNYFKPLYYKYKSIMNTEENSEDIKNAAEERFMNVCDIFLSSITSKFGITINSDWKSDNYSQIPALAMAVYSFFVLEFTTNIIDVCRKFLEEYCKRVYDVFEDKKIKKDAVTLVHKKEMSIENAVIISNIYDITTWILSQLSEEEFFKMLPSDYVPLRILQRLYEQGEMTGEFVLAIHDNYSRNVSLKGDVCFQLISMIEKGIISLNFKNPKS